MATRDEKLAEAIARAIVAVDLSLVLFAPDKSALARAGEAAHLWVACEVFADRNYVADGSLVSRNRPDALMHEPKESAGRVMRMLREGRVRSIDNVDVEVRAETVCVHGDTPGAVEFARVLRAHLEKDGVAIRAPKFPEGSEQAKQ
jgi:UPF0271 protein